MPELPEVETIKNGMRDAMLGQRIERVDVERYDLRCPIPPDFARRLAGRTMTDFIRRGKYILAFCDNGLGFVLHLGMSGRIKILTDRAAYNRAKHDHVVFSMSDGRLVAFSDPRRFGMLYLTEAEHWQSEKPFAAMGPEPMDDEFNASKLSEILAGRRAPIKQTLLDQNLIAGLGNIYVCEALYQARIHPARPSETIRLEEVALLTDAIKDVLQKAIEAGGSSLRDYKQADGNMGYFQYQFSVYDREGLPCPDCNCGGQAVDLVQRMVQSGRSTFFCPHRQA